MTGRSILVLVFAISVVGCSGTGSPDDAVLARVGPRVITVGDFRLAYELATAAEKAQYKQIDQRKKAFLDHLVQNELLAMAGVERGYANFPEARQILAWTEEQAVIRALYTAEVRNRVYVTEAELRDAYALASERLALRQVLFRESDLAQAAYDRIQNGASFEDLALERARSEEELAKMLTPTTFSWGELDEGLETIAFGLNHMEVPPPTRSRLGFHLIQLVNRTENLLLTENGFEARRHYLDQVIRRRREALVSRQVLRELAATDSPGILGATVAELAFRASTRMQAASAESPVPPYLQVFEIESDAEDLLNRKLVTFAGHSWTVFEYLQRVKRLPPLERPDLTTPGSVTASLAVLIRDDYLSQAGYEQGLESHPDVVAEVARRRRAIAASLMRKALFDSSLVSADYVEEFYSEARDQYRIPPRVRVREIMVRSETLADSLRKAVELGADLDSLAALYSVRGWASARGGDLGYFQAGAFGAVGERAFASEVGALVGPVPVTLGGTTVSYSIFRVLGREDQIDPPLREVYEKVRADALAARRRNALGRFLDRFRLAYPVSINQILLDGIPTTDELGSGRPMDMILVRRP